MDALLAMLVEVLRPRRVLPALRDCSEPGAEAVTAQEFIEGYAERSGTTPEALYRAGRVVVTCGPDHACNYEGCTGWALVGRESYEQDRELYGFTLALPDPEDQ